MFFFPVYISMVCDAGWMDVITGLTGRTLMTAARLPSLAMQLCHLENIKTHLDALYQGSSSTPKQASRFVIVCKA